jgi:thiol-disulfide isomerase/thioredoxin
MRALLLCCLLLPLGALGQGESVLHFRINGPKDERLSLKVINTLLGDTTTLDIDPVKQDEVRLPVGPLAPVILRYKDKDARFRTCAGCEATVAFDAEFLTETFKVEGGPEVQFLARLDSTFGNRNMFVWLMEQTAAATNVDGLEMDLFRLRRQTMDLLGKSAANDAFKVWFRKHVSAYYHYGLLAFASQRTERDKPEKAISLPPVMADEITWPMVQDRQMLTDRFHTALLVEYVRYRALQERDFYRFKTAEEELDAVVDVARANLTDTEVLRHFWYHYALMRREALPASELRRLIKLHGTEGSDLEQRLARLVGPRLYDAEPAKGKTEADASYAGPDIAFNKVGGGTFKLADLKGKVVYLDVWASWCGPCRKEFPYSKELMARFSKKDLKKIAFVFISIDNTEDAWMKALDQLHLGGTHGFSPGGWQSEICKKFGVNSIPRYMLFGPDGRPIELNAPRPSDPALYDLLRKVAGL